MIGFVSAISASLAVIILVTVSSLLGYVGSILPKTGIKKIDETHYQYIMDNVFVGISSLDTLTLTIDALETKNNIALESHRPVCNFGFNRSEREMVEIVTFNFLKINQYYEEDVQVLSAKTEVYDLGINYCYLDLKFSNNA